MLIYPGEPRINLPGGGGVRESGHLTRTTHGREDVSHPPHHTLPPTNLVSALAWGSRPAIPVQHQGSSVAPFARHGRRTMWLALRCDKHTPVFPTFQKIRSLFHDGVCSYAISRHVTHRRFFAPNPRDPFSLAPGCRGKRERQRSMHGTCRRVKMFVGTVCAEQEYLRAAKRGWNGGGVFFHVSAQPNISLISNVTCRIHAQRS